VSKRRKTPVKHETALLSQRGLKLDEYKKPEEQRIYQGDPAGAGRVICGGKDLER